MKSAFYKFFFNSSFIALTLSTPLCYTAEDTMFWWKSSQGANFGDDLSHVIVEKMINQPVKHRSLNSNRKILLAAGSILHYARDGDVIWGSGFREDPSAENRFTYLDVKAVRGPRTRDFLLQKGVNCPEVYGDPAVLMSFLFPEFKREEPTYDYIIIPNIGEMECFQSYKNVVLPTLPWEVIVQKMMQSKLVISSSLHGIIVAESFGVPARLLKMTWIESLLKYQDYYESTGRPDFKYATSVQEALSMGGEKAGYIDIEPLLESFPWDYFFDDPD
jgi:pyruvyltransferase